MTLFLRARDHAGTVTVVEVAPLATLCLSPPPAPPLLPAAPPPSAVPTTAPARPLPLSRCSPSPLTSAGTLPVRSLSLPPRLPALSSDPPEDASRPLSCPPPPPHVPNRGPTPEHHSAGWRRRRWRDCSCGGGQSQLLGHPCCSPILEDQGPCGLGFRV